MIPYGKQFLDQADLDEVKRVLQSDYLTTGPEVPAFEAALCAYTGASFAVANANGTAALHIASMAMDLKPGDQVVVPTISFVATANAACYCGAQVVFADVNSETALMTPETLLEALERCDPSRLKAIYVVHMGGHVADIVTMCEIAREHDVFLVEDACHALGSQYRDGAGNKYMVGACEHSDLSVFSFHPVKTITTGEGGATMTCNPVLAKKMQYGRSHGLIRESADWKNRELGFDKDIPNQWYYELPDIGYNYRLTDFQAALGRSQLAKMSFFGSQRQRLVKRYRQLAVEQKVDFRFVEMPSASDSIQHLMVALIDFESLRKSRREVIMELRDKGIGTQVHYIPIHHQPYYRGLNRSLELPGGDKYYARCLSVPLFPGMEISDVDTVMDVLADVIDHAK